MWSSSSYWKSLAERAIKTFAQTLVALIGANAVAITDLDWWNLTAVSATAALVSVLTSLASTPFGPKDSPSLVPVADPVAQKTGPDAGSLADPTPPLTDYTPPSLP